MTITSPILFILVLFCSFKSCELPAIYNTWITSNWKKYLNFSEGPDSNYDIRNQHHVFFKKSLKLKNVFLFS